MNSRQAIEKLANGESVSYSESGNSMKGIINHRQPVTLSPVDASRVEQGDVVLAKVNGRLFLHLVSAIGADDRIQICNVRGFVNGWTTRDKIYGIVTHVDGVERKSATSKVLAR